MWSVNWCRSVAGCHEGASTAGDGGGSSCKVIKGTGQPIGELLDFFWRIEFQLRGSPHVHSMWWIKDAPNLDTAMEDKLLHKLSKVGNTVLTHKELSTQEAAYRLCHLPLKENSRKVVFLNTARPEKQIRLLKSRLDSLQLEDDSSDIFIPGILDQYASRPNTAESKAMTFAHFAVWYDLDSQLVAYSLGLNCKMVSAVFV